MSEASDVHSPVVTGSPLLRSDDDNTNEDGHEQESSGRRRLYNTKVGGKAQGVRVVKINNDGTVVIQIKGPDLDRLSRLRVLRKDLGEHTNRDMVYPNQSTFIYVHVEPPKGWYSHVWHMVDYKFDDGSSRWLRARIINPPREDATDPETTMLKMNFVDFDRQEMIPANKVFSIINIQAVASIPEQAVTVKVVGLKAAHDCPEKRTTMERIWSASSSVYMITRGTAKPRRAKSILLMLTPQGIPQTLTLKPDKTTEDD